MSAISGVRDQVPKRVSVELLHVYASDRMTIPSRTGIELAWALTSDWDRSNYLLCTLVDDYSKGDVGFDWSAYRGNELFAGISFDYWCYESLLVEYAGPMFELLGDRRESRSELKYHAQRGQYSCSFLTAIWYCVRAGALQSDIALRRCGEPVLFVVSDTLVNILPKETSETEMLADRLVRLALGHAAPKILNHYY